MTHEVRLIVYGEPASKANSRKIVKFGNRPASIKSDKARAFEASVKQQVKALPRLMTEKLVVFIRIFYASERPDLDESIILDALQGLVYANDRQVREKHVYHDIDRKNPRFEIVVRPLVKGLI
ncbi:MAG: putative endodeoxyribonuclease [Prokaryotic dsDNA virus sp.]|nr:MAG: putative endodeoxyribonuclease [Prokaryotic dsDNA virus sp.]|tara:strand:+ start:30621 stop:30989 length:369 start_codon:yes stop_codon:yes gene_type:complete